MRIRAFPKTFVESFTLTELRQVSKRIEEYCYENEDSSNLPCLKWEQTLGLQKFNRRVIKDSFKPSKKENLAKYKSQDYSEINKNRVYVLHLDLLVKESISSLLATYNGVDIYNFDSLQASGMYLIIARKSRMRKLLRKNLKRSRLSWVGFDPNLRIQTGMNDYIELEDVFDTCFVLLRN